MQQAHRIVVSSSSSLMQQSNHCCTIVIITAPATSTSYRRIVIVTTDATIKHHCIVVIVTTDATINKHIILSYRRCHHHWCNNQIVVVPSLSSPQMQQAHRIVIVNANVAIKLLPFHLRSFHSLLLTNQSNRHHIVVIVNTDATIKSLSPRIVDATNNSDDQEESIGCGTENRIDEVEKCWIIGLMISVWIEWSTATVLWLLVYYLVKWEIMLGALVFIHRYYFQLLMMYEFLHAFDKSNAWGISSRPQILFWTFCVVPIPTYTVTDPTEYKKCFKHYFPQCLKHFLVLGHSRERPT